MKPKGDYGVNLLRKVGGLRLKKLGPRAMTRPQGMDWVGLMKTYNVDHQSPDSAGTATAYLSGIKARLGTIGLDAGAVREECASEKGHQVKTVFEKGKIRNLYRTLFITFFVLVYDFSKGIGERSGICDNNLRKSCVSRKSVCPQCRETLVRRFRHERRNPGWENFHKLT